MQKRQKMIVVTQRLRLIFFLSALAASGVFAQSAGVFLEKYTMREDFQQPNLGQFASYPPAQDIGYEPALKPTGDFGAPGGRALMRVVQPNRSGSLRFGFIRRVRLAASDDAALKFSYRFNSPTGSPTLELGIAGADGCRYVKEIAGEANRWVTTETALAEFRCGGKPLVPGTGIEGVYMVANLKNADRDVVYRFLIDDVALAGMRAAELKILAPQAAQFPPREFQISAQSFRADDRLALEAAAPVRLGELQAVLKNPEGRVVKTEKLFDDGTRGDRQAGDNVWTNQTFHQFAAGDAPGLWTVELKGAAPDGRIVSSRLRLLVYPADRAAHPRLYFNAAERSSLLAKTREPKLAKAWEYIQTTAKNTRASGNLAHGGEVFEMLDREHLLPTLLAYFDVLNRARSRIAYNAFLSFLTDDAEARAAAKQALLEVSNWRRWEPPWFTANGQQTYYPAGLLAVEVALGYDLLYDHLTEAERSQVRRALIEKQIAPTYREYFVDNRPMADTSNWISHTVGGALIAAAAIAGDVRPEESGGSFNLYLNGLLMKIEGHMEASFLPDGSYGEGISYQEFDLETLAPMTVALRRAFGIDYLKTTHLAQTFDYPLYTFARARYASLDMGDTHPPAGHGIPALVYQLKDPVVRWYYEQFDRPSLQQFIFFNQEVEPQSPADAKLPTSKIFADKGNAAFRTGWGENEIVMLFRAGPNFNHHHADQGSLLISAFGERLLTEGGWSDYYKDPYYSTFFTQAVGHNTVLVDGNPESQSFPDGLQFKALDAYPRITDWLTSEFYDGVGSDLASVYQPRLSRYTRRIAFVKPHYFVVFDDLQASGSPAEFDFLLHLPDKSRLETESLGAVYSGEKASLGVRMFTPGDARLSVRDGHIEYRVFGLRTPPETPPQPVFLDLKTAPAGEMQFLVALVPAKTEAAARQTINQMTELTGENLKGIRTDRGDETDIVLFRTGAAASIIRHADWAADASVLTVTQKAGSVGMFALQNARSLKRGTQNMFASDAPASAAASYGAGQIEAVVNMTTAGRITLFAGRSPARVLLDGRELGAGAFSFNRADNTVSFNVPAGQHRIQMILR